MAATGSCGRGRDYEHVRTVPLSRPRVTDPRARSGGSDPYAAAMIARASSPLQAQCGTAGLPIARGTFVPRVLSVASVFRAPDTRAATITGTDQTARRTPQLASTTHAANAHDPGPEIAGARAARRPRGRGRTDRTTGRWCHGTHRDRVVDRPDDDGGHRLLPRGRRHGRGAAAVLRRRSSRWSRSTRPTTRCPSRGRGAVARSHAARLRLRRQGARADDRPADRDEAPAEGHPRGAAGRARRQAAASMRKDLPESCATRCGSMFMDGLEPLRAAGQLGSMLLQYPKWFFPISRVARRDPAARELLGGNRSPSRCATGRGSTTRTSSGRCAS